MDAEEQKLTLHPTCLRLTVDGTTIDCPDWSRVRTVLANQARIHHQPVSVVMHDPEPVVNATYTVDEHEQLLDAPDTHDQDATITLHDWVLTIPGHGATHFAELATATARITALSEATNSPIAVQITGAHPHGALTERFVPEEQPEQSDEEPLDPEVSQLLLNPPAPPAPALDAVPLDDAPDETPVDTDDAEPEDDPEPEPEPEPDEPQETQPEPGQEFFLNDLIDQADAHQSEEETDNKPMRSTRTRIAVLAGIVGALLVLCLVAALALRPATKTPAEEGQAAPAWGQAVAAEPAAAVTMNRSVIAAATATGVAFIDAADGHTVAEHQTLMAQRNIYPLGEDAFYLTAGKDTAPEVCSPSQENTYTCHEVKKLAKGESLIHRAGTIAAVSGNDDESITVTTSGATQTTMHRPGKGMAYIAQGPDDTAVWASSRDGGRVIRAHANGSVISDRKLAAPPKGAKVTSWIGPTAQGNIAVLWSTKAKHDVLATHNPETGAVVSTTNVPGAGKDDARRMTYTGDAAVIGKTLVDFTTSTTHTLPKGQDKAPTPAAASFALADASITAHGTTVPAKAGVTVTELDEQRVLLINDGHLAVTPIKSITEG